MLVFIHLSLRCGAGGNNDRLLVTFDVSFAKATDEPLYSVVMISSKWRTTGFYPKATAAEVNAYLYMTTGRFYSHSQINRAEDRLGLSTTRSSTTAYQALHPRNIQWRWNYWHLPYPYGVQNIRRRDIIDLDECGVFIETVNRGSGKSYIGCRCREPGPYGHSERFNVLMAIAAEDT